jgi:H2-forming N5,N10-methylenetetrahydromethanopterin dehydrogenase-like enzyme
MAEIRDSWREVASRAEALGLKLRLHLEQEERAADASTTEGVPGPDGGPESGASGTEPTSSTRAAIDDLASKLKDAFESFGAAAKDPAVRSDVTDIGTLLKDALVTTFTAVGADVSEAVKDMTEAVKAKRAGGTDSPPPPDGLPDNAADDEPAGEGPTDS